MPKVILSAVGGVSAAFVSMLCCSGPLFLAAAGLSGAGMAAVLRPYRPVFLILTGVLLYTGFNLLGRDQAACDANLPCANPETRLRMWRMLWAATIVSLVFASSPLWASWVI